MKRPWVIALIIGLVGISLWLNLASGDGRSKAPPTMTAEQILAAPENRIFGQVTTDLRWKLAELDASSYGRWRDLPAPAKHVLALAWVERDDDPGTPPAFPGFAALLANTSPNMATLAEIAEAYEAIGAPAPAAVVMKAAQQSTADGSGVDRFGTLNREFAAASAKSKVITRLRSYIREHATEIAGARFDS